MECAASLAGRGEVHIQLVYALGATSTPPSGGAASNNPDTGGIYSYRPPLDGILWDQPRFPRQGVKSGRFRAVISFYADDAAFGGLARRSALLLKLLMKRGPDQGYFPETANSLFILNTPGQEDAARRDSTVEGMVLNFVSDSRYLGAYLGPQEDLEAWVKPQVEAWAQGVIFSGKIYRRHPQSAYAGLGILLQL